jgi:hypothetical protein
MNGARDQYVKSNKPGIETGTTWPHSYMDLRVESRMVAGESKEGKSHEKGWLAGTKL